MRGENPDIAAPIPAFAEIRYIPGGGDLRMWSLIRDFFGFLKSRKKWWLWPIVAVFILLAALVVATESALIAPFIYALF